MKLRTATVDKLLTAAGSVALFAALLVIARTPPAAGYELSVYQAYPAYFWILIVAASACGIGVLLHQAFASDRTSWWLAGLLLVVFTNSVLLGLPVFRGYAFFPSGDAMTHIGMMKDIMATGHIGDGNFYPIVHVLGVSLLDVAGLSYAAVTNLLPAFFSGLYVLNIYLLATILGKNRGQALLITAFAAPLVFSYLHTLVHPATMSTFMVPLILYFYHRRRVFPAEHRIPIALSVFLAVMLAFFHPVTTVFVITGILALNLSGVIYRQIARLKGRAPRGGGSTAWDYLIPLTGVVVFLIWHFPQEAILHRLRVVGDFLSRGARTSVYVGHTETLAAAGLTASQTIELFIARYGAVFVYGIVAGTAVLLVVRSILSRRSLPDPYHFSYAALFVVGVGASVFSLFGFTGEQSPLRISRFFLIVAPVISGFVFYDLITKRHLFRWSRLKPTRKALIAAIVLAVLAAAILSIFNVYHSPWVMNHNLQVSQMNIVGAEWFSNHQDRNVVTATRLGGVGLRRLEHFHFGRARATLATEAIPSHFGYKEFASISETFDFQDRYLLISEAGRVFAMMLPENARHMTAEDTEDDFARLRADPAAAQIYGNGDFEVWRVYGGWGNAGEAGAK